MPSSAGEKKTPAQAPQSVELSGSVPHAVAPSVAAAYRSAVSSTTPELHMLDISLETFEQPEVVDHKNMEGLEERDAMILECLPMVKYIALRIASRLPAHVELDDLIETGIIGLIGAAERFDPERGIKFRTFAEQRVRGEILDSLRNEDWVPRSLRRKKKDIEEAYHNLEQQLGRMATDEEVAGHLGITLDELHKSLDELKGVTLGSFEDVDGEGFISIIPDPDAEDPHVTLHVGEIRELLKKTIEVLPAKERLVVQLYYFDELTMKEIGTLLKITESRVSQLHTKAMLRLRGKLRNAQVDGR